MKANISHYNRLVLHPDYYYGKYAKIMKSVDKNMKCFSQVIPKLMCWNYAPNFPCYINYGIQSLECVRTLSAIAASNNVCIDSSHKLLNLFLLWGANGNLCFTTLKSFVDSYHPETSTILHVAIDVAKPRDNQEQSHSFLEAVLEAGGDEFIDTANDKGQRPLHRVTGSTVQLLIEHRAHVDAVDSQGKAAVPTGTFGVPSLYCTVANAIVKCSLPYQSIGLPSHVVEFVMLHDLPSCPFILNPSMAVT